MLGLQSDGAGQKGQALCTITTQKGLYRYNRLPFGVALAPAIWQRTMEQVLQEVVKTQCLLDDIIIAGADEDEHFKILEEVLSRLSRHDMTINMGKCAFFQDSLEFCGHRIDAAGLHKTPSKIMAVVEAPNPQDISQLRAFLGLVNYYNRFLPNLASVLVPLHTLLQKKTKWYWSTDCERAFQEMKQMIASERVLAHFNPDLPLLVSCDASPYGLGAVLSHVWPQGEEKPIAFASRTLSKAESNYSQIEKEALALVWGMKRFQQYLFGNHFTLVTDHQPLVSILNPEKGLPAVTAARLQRYVVALSECSFDIRYKSTAQHANADALSRLPVVADTQMAQLDCEEEGRTFRVHQLQTLPVTVAELRRMKTRDPMLARVFQLIQEGWPPKTTEECIKPYFERRHELTVEQGCVMWGVRVVIPMKLQLDELHGGHIGW